MDQIDHIHIKTEIIIGRIMDFDSRFYNTILENLDEGVYYVDTNRKILFWNQAAEKITGFSKKEVEGHRCYDNILEHVDDQGANMCKTGCPLAKTIVDGECRSSNFFMHHKDGHRMPVSMRVMPIINPEGMILGAVEVFSPEESKISDQEKIKELAKLAYLDETTGLPNKNYILMKRKSVHAEMEETERLYGMILLRIQNYDSILEKFGYRIGEKLLRSITRTLLHMLSRHHILGRWDETAFVCIVPDANRQMMELMKTRFQRLSEKTTLEVEKRDLLRVYTSAKFVLSKHEEKEQDVLNRFLEAPMH